MSKYSPTYKRLFSLLGVFPIWIYVSFSGVAVYWLLYR